MPFSTKDSLCKSNIERFNIADKNSDRTAAQSNYDNLDIGSSTPKERYEARFNSIVPDYENLNSEELKFLSDAHKAMKAINVSLEKLKSIGLHCSIGLAGGAVRDWTVGNTQWVKDFDIYLSIANDTLTHNIAHKPVVLPIFSSKQLSTILLPSTMSANNSLFNFDSNGISQGERYEILDVVLKEMLGRAFIIDEHYAHKNVDTQYLHNDIASNFKLTLPGLEKKIDLIVSEYPMEQFMDSFDFEICKCGISYIEPLYQFHRKPVLTSTAIDEASEEEVQKRMYDNLFYTHSCLKDFADKTLSLRGDHFGVEHIAYFMNKHYVKLKKKFSTYALKVLHSPSPNREEIEQYCRSIDEKLELNFQLPIKASVNNPLKI